MSRAPFSTWPFRTSRLRWRKPSGSAERARSAPSVPPIVDSRSGGSAIRRGTWSASPDRHRRMKYLLLIYSNPENWEHPIYRETSAFRELPAEERRALDRQAEALGNEIRAS